MVGAGQLFGANADTWKIGAGLCLAGMLVEFLSFSAFSIVVIIFGCRYRANKEMIPDPNYKIRIVDRILIALYINMAGQFVCSPLFSRLIDRYAQSFVFKNFAGSLSDFILLLKSTFTSSMVSRSLLVRLPSVFSSRGN
jgi:hypothetical protein